MIFLWLRCPGHWGNYLDAMNWVSINNQNCPFQCVWGLQRRRPGDTAGYHVCGQLRWDRAVHSSGPHQVHLHCGHQALPLWYPILPPQVWVLDLWWVQSGPGFLWWVGRGWCQWLHWEQPMGTSRSPCCQECEVLPLLSRALSRLDLQPEASEDVWILHIHACHPWYPVHPAHPCGLPDTSWQAWEVHFRYVQYCLYTQVQQCARGFSNLNASCGINLNFCTTSFTSFSFAKTEENKHEALSVIVFRTKRQKSSDSCFDDFHHTVLFAGCSVLISITLFLLQAAPCWFPSCCFVCRLLPADFHHTVLFAGCSLLISITLITLLIEMQIPTAHTAIPVIGENIGLAPNTNSSWNAVPVIGSHGNTGKRRIEGSLSMKRNSNVNPRPELGRNVKLATCGSCLIRTNITKKKKLLWIHQILNSPMGSPVKITCRSLLCLCYLPA